MNKGLDLEKLELITADDNKLVQMDILKYFADFCESNGLRYFLSDGTLIGAIRHNGYIPWDDDIDTRMPYPDYVKLINMSRLFENERFKMVIPGSEESYHSGIKIIDKSTIKIEPRIKYNRGYLGVDIDVFPIVGSPDDSDEFQEWAKRICKLYKAYEYKIQPLYYRPILRLKDLIKGRTQAAFCPGKSISDIWKMVDELINQYPYDESKYIAVAGIYSRFQVDSNSCKEYILWNFENENYRVPVGYDEILTLQFGDYMKLPPEDEQVTHHANDVYRIRSI